MKVQSSAVVHPKAELADDVCVGHYSIIGPEVKIGSGTVIGDHCVIEGRTALGKNNRIFTGAVIGSMPQDLKYRDEKTEVLIGDNNIIREYVTVNLGTTASGRTSIGNNNLLMAYAHIAHDCVIGQGAVIANAGTLAGHIAVEDKAILGGLAAVHQFVRIGRLSIVGGLSRVIQDVPPFSLCVGQPARVMGLNREGLKRAKFSSATLTELKHAFKVIFFSKLSIKHALETLAAENLSTPEVRYLYEFIKSSQRGICR